MKKFIASLLFLGANITMLFAATAYHSDDWIIIVGPVVVLAIIGTMYLVKRKLKERREHEAMRLSGHDTSQPPAEEELPQE